MIHFPLQISFFIRFSSPFAAIDTTLVLRVQGTCRERAFERTRCEFGGSRTFTFCASSISQQMEALSCTSPQGRGRKRRTPLRARAR